MLEINEANVLRYIRSFDKRVIPYVIQILEVFKCCDDLREILDKSDKARREQLRIAAEEAGVMNFKARGGLRPGRKEKKKEEEPVKKVRSLPQLTIVIDVCKHCGSKVMGEPIPNCEKQRSGRVFYAECSACKYYYEMFKNNRTGKVTKIEGGI